MSNRKPPDIIQTTLLQSGDVQVDWFFPGDVPDKIRVLTPSGVLPTDFAGNIDSLIISKAFLKSGDNFSICCVYDTTDQEIGEELCDGTQVPAGGPTPTPTPTPTPPPHVLQKVTNLRVTKVGYSRVRLQWERNSSYNTIELARSSNIGIGVDHAFLRVPLTIDATGFEDSTVSPQTSYQYTIGTCFVTPATPNFCDVADTPIITTPPFPTLRQFLQTHGFDPNQGTRSLRPFVSSSLRSIMKALDL